MGRRGSAAKVPRFVHLKGDVKRLFRRVFVPFFVPQSRYGMWQCEMVAEEKSASELLSAVALTERRRETRNSKAG